MPLGILAFGFKALTGIDIFQRGGAHTGSFWVYAEGSFAVALLFTRLGGGRNQRFRDALLPMFWVDPEGGNFEFALSGGAFDFDAADGVLTGP